MCSQRRFQAAADPERFHAESLEIRNFSCYSEGNSVSLNKEQLQRVLFGRWRNSQRTRYSFFAGFFYFDSNGIFERRQGRARDARGIAMTMQELRWEMANIRVGDHAEDGLKQGTLVRVLFRWEQDRFPGEPSLGKVVKIKVKTLLPPYVVKDIDATDVA